MRHGQVSGRMVTLVACCCEGVEQAGVLIWLSYNAVQNGVSLHLITGDWC